MRTKFFDYWSVAFFLLLAAVLFHWLGHTVNNPDAISYLLIARHYLKGEWFEALNGYWSPMISWLLILPLSLHLDDVVGFKMIQLIIACFGIFLWQKIVVHFGLQGFYKFVLLLAAVFLFLNYSMRFLTADVLFVVIAMWLLLELLRKSGPVKTGCIGALLYFAKSFGAVWFVALIIIIILKNFIRKESLSQPILSLLVFMCISLIWIVPVSLKYHHFTISEAAHYNMTEEVAPLPGQTELPPIVTKGIYDLQGHNRIAWEEPTLYENFHLPSFSYYLQVVKRNFLTIYYFDFRRQAGMILLMIAFLFFCFSKRTITIHIHTFSPSYFVCFSPALCIVFFYTCTYALSVAEHFLNASDRRRAGAKIKNSRCNFISDHEPVYF